MLGMAALLTPSTLAEALPAVNADYIISLETSLPLLGDLMELLVKKKKKINKNLLQISPSIAIKHLVSFTAGT